MNTELLNMNGAGATD